MNPKKELLWSLWVGSIIGASFLMKLSYSTLEPGSEGLRLRVFAKTGNS